MFSALTQSESYKWAKNGKGRTKRTHTLQSEEPTKKKCILVCYINCKGNKGTKNNDKTTKNQKGGKGLRG